MLAIELGVPLEIPLLLWLTADPTQGATGLTPTAEVAAPGAGYSAGAGTVREVGGGGYGYLPTVGEVSTAGVLWVRLSAASAAGWPEPAQVRAHVYDDAVEGAETFREQLRLMRAVLVGLSTGASGTTPAYLAADGLTPRVSATVDASGNRVAVVTDAS